MSRIQVDQNDTLIAFLVRKLEGTKRSTIKSRLKFGAVSVNGEPVTRATEAVSIGDIVEIKREGAGQSRKDGLRVLLLDEHVVVVEKPSGLLSVPSHKPGVTERNAVELAAEPLLNQPKLFACHRLDRESSGVLLLARNQTVRDYFFASWPKVEKRYMVVVEGIVRDDEGTINAPLFEHPHSKAVHVSRKDEAKDSITHFRVRERAQSRTLLEVRLETGRRHQIRAHLAHIGHPVTGDRRYGDGRHGAARMCLHSSRLKFAHPATSEMTVVESPAPALFTRICRAKI